MKCHQTEVFTLEPIVAAHAVELFQVLREPDLYHFLDHGPPPNVDYLGRTFRRWEATVSPDGKERWFNWAIKIRTGALVGHIQATLTGDSSWVAYMLSKEHWGKGIARAATAKVIAHLTHSYACKSFLACVERENSRSIGLLRSLGFVLATPEELSKHSLTDSEALYVLRLSEIHAA